MCVADRELRYVRMNEAYARVLGDSIEAMLGRTMHETLHPSVRDAAIAIVRRVFETGEAVIGVENPRQSPEEPDRERVWLVNCHPVRRGGEVVGVAAVLQDITTVRRAEEAAVARLNELESIYRNAPVGLSLTDSDLRYLRVNQTLADMNGVAIEDMVGRTYRDLSPDTADTAEPFFRRIMERGTPVRNLEVRSRPPGDPELEHVYLLSMDPVTDPYGVHIGYVSAVQDVTEQRRIEETAGRRLAELEILYANTPVGLCHLDTALRIVQLNPRFAALSDRPLEEQVGTLAGDVLLEEIARQLLPELGYVARTGQSSAEIEIRGGLPGSGDREYTWISHTHPVRSPDGVVTGVITVLQDVSAFADRRRRVETVRDRLAEAQHVSRMGSWEWNLLEDEVWWSNALYDVFGEDPATHVPSYDGFFERVHPNDRQKMRELIERALGSDEAIHMTYRIIRPDGAERMLSSVARLERTDGGIPARLVGTCQDVTDQADAPGIARWSRV